jgi:autotransporter-associated beta strand protein
MVVAYSVSTNGSLTVAPGGTLDYGGSTNAFFLTVNQNSYGVLNLAGGNVDFGTRGFKIGNAGTGQTGILNLDGGTFTLGQNASTSATSSNFYVNFAGGTLKAAANLNSPFSPGGGLATVSTIFGPIDNSAAVGNASQNFAGGFTVDSNGNSVTLGGPLIGATGNGVKQTDISIVGGSGYTGAPMVAFTGGTLAANGTPASGYSVINPSTGEVTGIVITSPGAYSVDPTVTLTGGGGTGASVTLSTLSANAADSGLTKSGTGTLTLSGASSYTGATSVDVGALNLTGSLTSNVTVANNANLGGEGSTTGSVTFNGTSDLDFDPSTSGTYLTAASVNGTGASVTVAPAVPVTGTGIVVLSAAGGITGTAGGAGNNFIYTGRGNLYFNGGNTQLLIDTAPVSLAWRGNDGTNPTFWNLNTTANWDSGIPNTFFTGDAVTFDDTAASYTVDINAANVLPGNITFNNTTTYTLQGAFGIYGGATLTKNASGTTVMNSSNGYTGATTVAAGVLNIRNANALGNIISGTSVTSGAALEIQGGITTAAEPLTLDGSGISSNGALRNISGNNTWGAAVALASATTIGSDAGTLVIPSLTGAFAFTKVGAGTVNITGATAVTSTTVEAGTLYLGAQTAASTTTTLGAGNAVTLNGSSNLTIRRTNTGVTDVTGAIGGSGSLTLVGDNAAVISATDFAMNNPSTYSGGTSITGARANITTSGAALGTGLVTTGGNGQVFVQTNLLTLTNNFSIGGQGWNEPSGFLGALRLNGTTLSGTISLTADTRITGGNSSTLSGIISGNFGMNFFEDSAIGTISLSGVNTYTGTTTVNSVGSGTTFPNLIVSDNSALGTTAGGTIVYGTGTTGTGAALTLATGITVTDETLTLDPTANGYRATLQTSGAATWDGNLVAAGTGGFLQLYSNTGGNLTIGSSDADTITGTNLLAVRGSAVGTIHSTISNGTGGIFKTDGGIWTITSNNNDFTGTPSAANGILSVSTIADSGVNSALGAGTVLSLGANSTATGTLQFTGAAGGSSDRALSINNGATGGAGAIENTVSGQLLTLSGALTVATPASACSLTLAGAGNGLLSGGIAGTPALALRKTGAGTWTVSGASTYTGTTNIGGGTLVLTTASSSLAGGLTFGSALGNTNVGTLDLSGVASSATFGGALNVQTNSATDNTITLGAAKTLTISGGLTMSNNVDAGETRLTVTGGGALVVNGASISVGNNSVGSNNSSEAHLNVAALDSFTTTLSANLTIQASGDNSASDASSLTLSNVANSITAAAVRVGNSSTGSAQRLWLGGGTNVIQTDLINLGAGSRDSGVIDFASSGGSVSLRNVAGTGRVAAVNLGPQGTQATAYTTANLIDLTGNTADVAIGTFATSPGAKTAANTNDLGFDSGTLDILSINMAFAKGTGASTNRITIGGGTVRLGGSAAFSDAATGTLTLATAGSGELIINGGTVTTTASLLKGTGGTGTATVTLNGGTLDMGGTNIGAATDTVVLAAQSGTLRNVGEVNNGAGWTKSTAGTLTLAGTNTYTGTTSINAGILVIGGNNVLPDVSPVSIATATLDSVASVSDTLGTLDAAGSAKINIGSGATLAFADSSGVSWAGGTLDITGTFVSGSSLRFGTNNSGLTPTQLGLITLNGASGSYSLDANGFLVTTAGGYASWASTNALTGTPSDDYDSDGVSNALEYLLGGTALTNDLGKLPTISTSGGNLRFTFKRDQASIDGTTVATIQVGTTLATWPGSYSVPDIAAANDPGVTVLKDTPTGFDTVTLSVPQSPDAAKFARLKVTVVP